MSNLSPLTPAKPTITAIIPTFRRPELLRRAVESVLSQTYLPLRVHILDNASGDATGDIAREFAARDPRVVYTCHSSNIGAQANFQAGYAAVETPYFSFLSDDDMLMPHFYETAMRSLEAHPQARFFCGQIVKFNPTTLTHMLSPRRVWHDGYYEPGEGAVAMADAFFTWTSCLFATELREANGPINRSDVPDVAFLIKSAASVPFVVRMTPCALFTSWDAGVTSALSIDSYIASYAEMEREIVAHGRLTPDQLATVKRLLAKNLTFVMGQKLRTAFDARDWDSVLKAAAYLRSVKALGSGKWMRAVLSKPALRGGVTDGFVRWCIKVHKSSREARQADRRGQSAEELVARYAQVSAPTPVADSK